MHFSDCWPPTNLAKLLLAPTKKLFIKLNGRLNKCRAISPRYNLKVSNLETWVANLLPSRQFGIIVLTTSYGILDHKEALKKRTGGKILGFFY